MSRRIVSVINSNATVERMKQPRHTEKCQEIYNKQIEINQFQIRINLYTGEINYTQKVYFISALGYRTFYQ